MRLTRQSALLIALGCGAIAALLAYTYLKRMSASQEPRPAPPVSVVVAREDIPAQSIIQASSLSQETLPPDKVPPDAVKDPADIIGQVALSRIPAGKAIRTGQASERSASLGLNFVVPAGMRAVTVATDPITGVAGFLKPGNRVDVLATFEVGRDTIAKTVLQDIELLAIGAEALPPERVEPPPESNGKGGAPKAEEKAAPKPVDQKIQATATLAVKPDDAMRLVIAASKGNVRLSLRPANEHAFVPVPTMDAYDVIGQRPPSEANSSSAPNAAPTAAAPPAQKPALPTGTAPQPTASTGGTTGLTKAAPSVEVIRGSQRETVTP